MKYALAMFAVLAALVVPQALTAQEPLPDLGETNVFLLACQYATEIGLAGDYPVRYCRRAAPDEIVGNEATIHVKVGLPGSSFLLDVKMHKSLWGLSTLVITG